VASGLAVAVALVTAVGAWADSSVYSSAGTFDVPTGVSGLHVVAIGGHGGAGSDASCLTSIGGGQADLVETNLGVMPGQTLYVQPGANGTGACGTAGAAGGAGGGGAGGTGAVGGSGTGGGGGGGGGASDIRTVAPGDPGSLESRLVVAPGGGGGGGGQTGGGGGFAQSGGSNGGQTGGCTATPGSGGQAPVGDAGGTGGAAGGGANPGITGSLGIGGNGGNGTSSFGGNGGGGAGGGWYGGGGGGATSFMCAGGGGGGGGSFYADPAKTAQTGVANTLTAAAVQLYYMPPNGGGNVVISQVYGGGGTTSPPFANDFVELFNRSDTAVDLTGWSVQYASASGQFWSATALPSGLTIPPGGYVLVQEADGASGDVLPTPDATGVIAMGQASGKVALVSSPGSVLSGKCPSRLDGTRGHIVDFVGYGYETSGNPQTCFEGSSFAATLSATSSDKRTGAGCLDSDDNAADSRSRATPTRATAHPPSATASRPPTSRRRR
jgi:hypothetical protein